VSLRLVTLADAEEAAAHESECRPEPITPELVRLDWTGPRVDLERDSRRDGTAFVLVETQPAGAAWLGFYGVPSQELVAWGVSRAAESSDRVLTFAWSRGDGLREALTTAGFRHIRNSYRMLIDLAEPPEPAVWPDGVTVRGFREGDERTFYELQQETFLDHWEPFELTFEEWLHYECDESFFRPDLCFLVETAGGPAGFAFNQAHPSKPELGWVGTLGVRRAHRRRGLGRALLLHSFAALRAAGFPEAALGVDAESLTGANRLYESAGMHVSEHFEAYEKSVGSE
jgi:mycothiol synthase